MQDSKQKPRKDGLSEESVVTLLQRLIVTNFARFWLVCPDQWEAMAEVALASFRQKNFVLSGGEFGLSMGSFQELLSV